MRVLALFAALVLAACESPAPVTPTPSPSPDPNAFAITALLDLSGAGAAIGTEQRQEIESAASRLGGGVRVRVTYVDVAGDRTKLLLALKQADDARADAAIVGSAVPYDDLVGAAIAAAAMPVLFTLPVDEPAGRPGGAWAFALAPTLGANAELVVRDAEARGLLGTVYVLTYGPDRSPEHQTLLATLRARRVPLAELDLAGTESARVLRVAAVAARSLFLVGPARAYVEALRGAPVDGGATLYLSYLTTRPDLVALGASGAAVSWPGSRSVVERPTDTIAATAGDAVGILVAARTTAKPPLGRERLRAALDTLTFSGVATRYTFTAQRHAGFALDDLAPLRWSPASGARVAPDGRSAR